MCRCVRPKSEVSILAMILATIVTGQGNLAIAADATQDDANKPASTQKPPNLIAQPEYTFGPIEDDQEEADTPASEKLQYEPMTDERPVISERNAKAETGNAVEYETGTELMVSPAPDFVVKEEKIDEKVVEPISDVSLAPPATSQR